MDRSVKLLGVTQNGQSVLIFTNWDKSVYFFDISDGFNWDLPLMKR